MASTKFEELMISDEEFAKKPEEFQKKWASLRKVVKDLKLTHGSHVIIIGASGKHNKGGG